MKKTVKKCSACKMPLNAKSQCSCDKNMCKYCCKPMKKTVKKVAKKKVVKKKKAKK